MKTHPVPAEALDKHIAILGKTGSGKSNLAKTITEDLLARGARVCVIDPTGTWWGMRLMADGETPSGHPIVIFGGQHADLPIGAAHGEHIARVIGTSSTPAIVDTRDLTVSNRTTFFTDFAETLVRTNRGELTLIVDEAHLFMPQAGARAGGAAPAMLHAGNNLVSLGRGVGLRIILISQRPAKLHKDSLTQVETLVAMRLIAPQDRKAIGEWIDEWAQGRDAEGLTASLPSLPTGDAWVWSPEIGHLERASCPLATTYDSGRVQVGGNPDLPPIELSEISGQLEKIGSDLLADDPKRLKARIRELERTLRNAPTIVDEESNARRMEAEVERRVEAIVAPYREKCRKTVEAWEKMIADASSNAHKIAADLDEIGRISRGLLPEDGPAVADARPQPNAKEAAIRQPKVTGSAPGTSAKPASNIQKPCTDPALTGPQQRILNALAWLSELGIADRASRIQVAFLAGYKPGGGAFNNTLGSLRSAGLIEYPSAGEVSLTEEGSMKAETVNMPLTNEALHRAVMEKLSGPQRRVLQPLIDRYPLDMDVHELADDSGYEVGGGAFNNTRGSLRSLGLIDYPGPGRAVALPVLFVGVSE